VHSSIPYQRKSLGRVVPHTNRLHSRNLTHRTNQSGKNVFSSERCMDSNWTDRRDEARHLQNTTVFSVDHAIPKKQRTHCFNTLQYRRIYTRLPYTIGVGWRVHALVTAPWPSYCMNPKLHGIARMLRRWHKWTRPRHIGRTGVWFAVLLIERHYSGTGYTPTVFAHKLGRRWHDQWNRSTHIWIIPTTMPTLVSTP
jgi:hypothetical protein